MEWSPQDGTPVAVVVSLSSTRCSCSFFTHYSTACDLVPACRLVRLRSPGADPTTSSPPNFKTSQTKPRVLSRYNPYLSLVDLLFFSLPSAGSKCLRVYLGFNASASASKSTSAHYSDYGKEFVIDDLPLRS